MRLYHAPRTRSTRVLWMLEEAGAPYDVSVVEDRRGPEHRARHPLGRVPVVEEDGGFVFESPAICLHLADLHPEAGLAPPPGTHERGLVYQWLFFAISELEAPTMEVAMQGWNEGEPDEAVVSAATERFRVAAQVIEDRLADHQYLVGDRFTVADLMCVAVLGFSRSQGLTEGLPNLAAYVDRIEARPARARALEVSAPA